MSRSNTDGLVSVVIPIYNPPTNLFKYIDNLAKVLHPYQTEFFLVCDGRDALTRLEQLDTSFYAEGPDITVLKLRRNYGQQHATWHGITKCQGTYIITVDEDGQHTPTDVARVLTEARLGNHDFVVGTYDTAGRSRMREYFSALYHSRANGQPKHGKRSSLRVITAEYFNSITGPVPRELLLGPLLWERTDYRSSVPINLAREQRPTTYTRGRLLELGIVQILNSDVKTFELALIASIGFVGMSFLAFIYAICAKIFGLTSIPSITTLFSLQVLTIALLVSGFCIVVVVLRRVLREMIPLAVYERHRVGDPEQTEES